MIYKRILIFLCVYLCLLNFSVVIAMPKIIKKKYVNDFANLIDMNTKKELENKAVKFAKNNNAQVIIVTVSDLENKSVEDYANELFNTWNIADNGILLLVSLRETRIEVGYGLEGIITDGTAGYILDKCIMPDFKQKKYSQAITKGFNEILEVIGNSFYMPKDSFDLQIIFYTMAIIFSLMTIVLFKCVACKLN